jgi:hypothetical protein
VPLLSGRVPSVANDDLLHVGSSRIAAFNVFYNDLDVAGRALSVEPASGSTADYSYTLASNGAFSFSYKGDVGASQSSSYTFQYSAFNGQAYSNTATITVLVGR